MDQPSLATTKPKKPSGRSSKSAASKAVAAAYALAAADSTPASDAVADVAPSVEQQYGRISSDDENVILQLSFSDCGSGHPRAPQVGTLPDAYNAESDSAFSSHPCAVEAANGIGGVLSSEAMQHPHPSPLLLSAQSIPSSLMPVPTYSPDVLSLEPPTACDAPPQRAAGAASKVVRLLAEFEEKSKAGDWPLSTSVHCYWCCHRFTTPPFGLPIKYSTTTGRFQVIGCFCSLECACAYNFSTTRDSVDECLNRYSLINSLSSQLGLGRAVKPAPDRLALSIFGGHMSIGEFRAYVGATRGQQQVVVNCPPMQSVTQQVEEVCESDLCSEYRYVPLDSERVSRYQEKIRLTRTKPLINFKNTLDHSMKLKYGAGGAGTAPPAAAAST